MRPSLMALLILSTTSASLAAETTALFDGADASTWDTARDKQRLNRELHYSELRSTDEQALLWRFSPIAVRFNDIFLRREIAMPFDAVRIRLRNAGDAITFAVKVRDAKGAEWTANQISVAAGTATRWLDFPTAEWKPASWSKDQNGRLDFPLASLALIAFNIDGGRKYEVAIERVEVLHPERPIAAVTALQIPQTANAGDTLDASVALQLNQPCRLAIASLELHQGKSVTATCALPLQATELAAGTTYSWDTLSLKLSPFIRGGNHTVRLRIGEAKTSYDGKLSNGRIGTVNVTPRKPGTVRSSVRRHRGTPRLFINGTPHSGMAYTAYHPDVEVFTDFTQAGVNLFSFSATPTEAGYNLSRTTWTAPDEYDYSQLDERVAMVLEANPEAFIFPRLYLHAPSWWSKLHPEDVVQVDRGDGKPVPFIHRGTRPAPSWASERWRNDTIEGLRRLIQHVEESPYADRVIGYHIASGTTEEWMMWGANEREWVDYSPVNVARFQLWLRDRYRTVSALRAGWATPDVTFKSVTLPTRKEREKTHFGSFRHPEHEQRVTDFYLYNSHMVADTICTFARAVKDITRRQKTVGVFYGYLLQLCGEQRQQNAGHLALGHVLASPDIDFLCSPTSYRYRQLGGEGTSHFMSLLGSVKAHGKLWFNENDIRTSLAPGKVGSWGKPETIAGDILQQDKELANAIANGAAQWWFDVGRNRYDDDMLMQRIAALNKAADSVIPSDRSWVDDVALVVDEKSLCYLKVGDPLGRELLIDQLPSLHRIGAAAGHYLAGDLARLTRHKLLLFTTSFAPDAGQRQAIDTLKGNGRVLVFCHAQGLYQGGQIAPEGMSSFTGIQLKLATGPHNATVTLNGNHPLTRGVSPMTFGPSPERSLNPLAYADDPDATVLGTLPNGVPGLVIKRFPDWTAVHCAVPKLPLPILQRLAGLAGVHRYIDTADVVWAARDLVSVCVKEPGSRAITLPNARKVRDLYTGEPVADSPVKVFRATFVDRATRVFMLE